ncbi:MAG: type II toxin-antitoxin system RelE/ParE family toxin [Actinobacteria bacterium]|nr:type II toxin-antitoxin system RelE/ParE family toxin [Actinomycetota bacterium]
MNYRVVFTPRARADTVNAFRWIAEQSPEAAARWYGGLEKAVAKLDRFPERCPVVEEESELLGITLRLLTYGRRRGRFRILFSIDGETVYLHYVRHTAQGGRVLRQFDDGEPQPLRE